MKNILTIQFNTHQHHNHNMAKRKLQVVEYVHGSMAGNHKDMTIEVQHDVTTIAPSAFYDYTGLGAITIPNSVTSIGDCAFEDCTGLVAVTPSPSVTTIGDYAFRDCTGLIAVTIPPSVTSIGEVLSVDAPATTPHNCISQLHLTTTSHP